MPVIRRRALVAQPPARLFDLVNDVERYPQMYPWCSRVEVLEHGKNTLAARLHVRTAGVEFSFATLNTLEPPSRMHMRMIEGPLKRLDGVWSFEPYGEGGCEVQLHLEFEPKSRLLGFAGGFAFQRLADRLVEDFCACAARLGPSPVVDE